MRRLIYILCLIGVVFGQGNVRVVGRPDGGTQSHFWAVDSNGLASMNNWALELGKGNINGHTSIFKFGRNTAVGATEEVVWDGGGDYVFLRKAEYINVTSTSAQDQPDSAGAHSILLFGLDDNKEEITEIVIPNGTTPVQTLQKFRRLNRALVLTSGTNSPVADANIGIVSMVSDSTTTLQARMLANNGQTLMAVYTIPAGKTGYATGVSFAVGEGKQCLFKAKFRNGETEDNAFSVKYVLDLFESSFFGTLQTYLRIPEKTDIAITAISSAAGTDAGASFGIILVDN